VRRSSGCCYSSLLAAFSVRTRLVDTADNFGVPLEVSGPVFGTRTVSMAPLLSGGRAFRFACFWPILGAPSGIHTVLRGGGLVGAHEQICTCFVRLCTFSLITAYLHPFLHSFTCQLLFVNKTRHPPKWSLFSSAPGSTF
jgi:hypothetical protein